MKKGSSVLFALMLAFLLGFTSAAVAQPAEPADYPAVQSAENVELVGSWPFGRSYAVAYDSARDIAFCGSGGGVFILDVSDPASPEKLSEIYTEGIVQGLFYQPGTEFLYVAAEEAGLEVWDIEDPANPAEMGYYVTTGYAYGVALSGSYAYIAASGPGLRVIDISDPSSPSEVGYYDTPGYARDVALADSYIHVADGEARLQIYRYLGGPTVAPGDANGDGEVNVLDLAYTARIIAGLEPNGDLHPGADANQDGEVNVLDLAQIARIIAGLA